MMMERLVAGALLWSLSFMPAVAGAHPHAWIDLRSRVVLDDAGRVRALELYWLFDEWYTIFIANEFVEGDTPASEYLTELGQQNIANLAEYDYFTEVTVGDEVVAIGAVTSFETGLQNERLWMRFEVPLAAPLDLGAGEIAYRIYDPTYYIEILHMEGEPVTFAGDAADACLGRIVPANPSFEAVSLAAALDRDETAGDGLGRTFAETVVIDCS